METKTDNNEDPQTIVLKEILKWIKFGTMPQVKTILESTLDIDQKKRVYQLSDGSRGIPEIGRATEIKSTATIFNYWNVWEKQHLGSRIPVAGGERFKREFDLEEFGLTVQIGLVPKRPLGKKDNLVEPERLDNTKTHEVK